MTPRISEGYYTTIALNPSNDGAYSDPCPRAVEERHGDKGPPLKTPSNMTV